MTPIEMKIVSRFNHIARFAIIPLFDQLLNGTKGPDCGTRDVLVPQRPHLRQKEPSENEDQWTNDIAELQLGQLQDVASKENRDLAQ